ncbi:DUF2779 domain-containing protein [Phenylobacterium immobile]|uniref:DUF2779 domain-containing protein n=1 Tax=Phenylobacterium immobile TaxID=21 RepID=UPI000B085E7C|nr:DUF2779 domain-containing protein [Phenylobacterium immobile]
MIRRSSCGMPYHDRAAFAAAVGAWSFPRHYLDFETIAHVVPSWAGTRPYQAVPFQFSCQVEKADGALTHTGFLDLSGDDPSRACAEALIACIGDEGGRPVERTSALKATPVHASGAASTLAPKDAAAARMRS